jgi:hypothetical protein
MRVNIPDGFRQLREGLAIEHVSIGSGGIYLIPVRDLDKAQRGYGDVADDTAWQPEWAVIGHEESCRDPLFIDIDDDDYPVYMAEHGTGTWSPQLIAFTFRHFSKILERLHTLSRGRANPAELKRRPISDDERRSFIEFIRRDSSQIDFSFWESLLGVDGDMV